MTIERPEVLNALHPEANRELSVVFDAFAADSRQRVAILTGRGDRAFCSGFDLKHPSGGAAAHTTGMAGLTFRFDLDKPVIAAVNGLAFGGGFEIVLACDLVVAAGHARFALPEVTRSLVPRSGAHRLPRVVGPTVANDVLLAGRVLDAEEAFRYGLVNEVVVGDPVPAAIAMAGRVCRGAPLATMATKRVVRDGLEHASVRRALEASYPYVDALRATADFGEGVAAFRERREPMWSAS